MSTSTTSNTSKNYYGKKPRRKKRTSKMQRQMVNVARQVVQAELKDELELKFYDTSGIGLAVNDTSGLVLPLSQPLVKGTGIDSRIGNKVSIKSLFVRLQVQANASASYNNIRLMIIRWMSAGTPVIGSILLSSGLSPPMRHLAQLNYSSKPNFQVKYDQTYLMADTANLDIPAIQLDKFYIKKFGDAFWDDANSPIKGQLYLIAISDSAVQTPQLTYTSRIRYTDA